MNELERCPDCDGWGWHADPTSRFGPEVPCATCGITGRVPVPLEAHLVALCVAGMSVPNAAAEVGVDEDTANRILAGWLS